MSRCVELEEPDWEELERLHRATETEEQFQRRMEESRERSRIADETEPRAVSARYNPETGRIDIHLRDGCTFSFPPHLAQGLRGADPELLDRVQVLAGGAVLLWEELDTGFMVPILLERRFGNDRWMAMLRDEARVAREAEASAVR